ncbi:related to 2-methylcitrate dehydratase (PrpD) [Rhynchosporium agropyri]|uniref:Related to 2-methylcitrate dehydratase (PrpD) n=1 Tax=Rhynchosporium agropyri TaxID=914238 RepID=A0A1E1LHM8_9HELO|nr:related to 2-methylcitrate dehydratase (PrpD) [Rhynchosporium agropyri]
MTTIGKTRSNNLPDWDQLIVVIKDYVFHYEIENATAWKRSREILLDTIGVAILAVKTSAECKALLGPFVPGVQCPNGFRLPGTSFVLDPVKGAWDMGTMIRWLDFNDCIGGVDWGHPSDNLGSILSVSDWLSNAQIPRPAHAPPLTIRTVLEALIKATEIQGAFNVLNSFNKLGMDHTLLVKLASTAVVSWLMGLSEDETCAALSHVFMDGGPLRIFRAGSNTIPRKAWAAGDACMRAVQIALLVKNGQPGARTVLTMPRWGFYENTWHGGEFKFPRPDPAHPATSSKMPGSPFQTYVMERVAFKLVPCEGHSLYAIEAMQQQSNRLRQRNLDPDKDVASIVLKACRPIVLILDKPGDLNNYADRDHSIQYVLGVTLLKGEPPSTDDYRDESPWASSVALRDVAKKMRVIQDEGFTNEYLSNERSDPSPPVASVTIYLTSGEVLEEIISRDCPGVPKNPTTSDGVMKKFRKNMNIGNFKTGTVDLIEKMVLEEESRSASDLIDLLVQ